MPGAFLHPTTPADSNGGLVDARGLFTVRLWGSYSFLSEIYGFSGAVDASHGFAYHFATAKRSSAARRRAKRFRYLDELLPFPKTPIVTCESDMRRCFFPQ